MDTDREHSAQQTKQSRWGFRGMTVREWLELLIVPVVLALITVVFSWQQNERQHDLEDQRVKEAQKIESQRAEAERDLAVQRAQDEALQAYLNQMSSLLLEKDLRTTKEDSEVRTLARARTLTVLGRLDRSGKIALMQFLVEADLVQRVDRREPIISLRGADLSDVGLFNADLDSADLFKATLRGAHLGFAHLSDANLSDADLSDANLIGAYLDSADLDDANLSGANLRWAHLSDADLRGADLSRGADLYRANFSDARLSVARLSDANLRFANLSNANLSGADLSYANLRGANLGGGLTENKIMTYPANLSGADLSSANLSGADLSGATNLLGDEGIITYEELEQQAKSLKAATMPNGQKYEDWLKDREKR